VKQKTLIVKSGIPVVYGGEDVNTRINALITAAGPRPPWLAYYLEWLDEAARARFEQEFAAHNPWRAAAQP